MSECNGEAAGVADLAAVRGAVAKVMADADVRDCPDVGARVLWRTSLLLKRGVGIPARGKVIAPPGQLRFTAQSGVVTDSGLVYNAGQFAVQEQSLKRSIKSVEPFQRPRSARTHCRHAWEGWTVLVADPVTFADRLKELREQAGVSQYRLAQVSGLSKQTISQLEKGTNEPSWETVRRLARGLKVDVTAFDVGELTIPGAGDDEPEEPPPPPAKKPAPKKPKR